MTSLLSSVIISLLAPICPTAFGLYHCTPGSLSITSLHPMVHLLPWDSSALSTLFLAFFTNDLCIWREVEDMGTGEESMLGKSRRRK